MIEVGVDKKEMSAAGFAFKMRPRCNSRQRGIPPPAARDVWRFGEPKDAAVDGFERGAAIEDRHIFARVFAIVGLSAFPLCNVTLPIRN